MLEGLVSMSWKEVVRLRVIRDLAEGRIRQRQAADLLDLGLHQVKRLAWCCRQESAVGLVCLRRAFGFGALR